MSTPTGLGSKTFEDFNTKRNELARLHFEPELTRMGLSVEQIERLSLEELNSSLVQINDLIDHPDAFGTLHLRISPDARLLLTTSRGDAHLDVSILPLLLERKSLILARIRSLSGQKRVETLKDLIATVTDQNLKSTIEHEFSQMEEQSKRLFEQERAVARVQADQIASSEEAILRLRSELFDRRLRAWAGFFSRESMATFVGAFLLVVLTFVQVSAIFLSNIHTSEIVNNAFLLLLGYFFGQSVVKSSSAG